ncbi:MAG TPA: hypothetical protein VNL35_20770 [Chloroflexota bacterium]|nr:hypothetical protein [Chloroflexota bacterium]
MPREKMAPGRLQPEIRFPTSQRPPTPSGQAGDLAAFPASLK